MKLYLRTPTDVFTGYMSFRPTPFQPLQFQLFTLSTACLFNRLLFRPLAFSIACKFNHRQSTYLIKLKIIQFFQDV